MPSPPPHPRPRQMRRRCEACRLDQRADDRAAAALPRRHRRHARRRRPRVERVLTRVANPGEPWKVWASHAAQVVVAGSTWQEEEQALRTLDWHPQRRLVLVPHDISAKHLNEIDALWEGGAIRASAWLALESLSGRRERRNWSTAQGCSSTCTESARSLSSEAVTARAYTTSLNRLRQACPS